MSRWHYWPLCSHLDKQQSSQSKCPHWCLAAANAQQLTESDSVESLKQHSKDPFQESWPRDVTETCQSSVRFIGNPEQICVHRTPSLSLSQAEKRNQYHCPEMLSQLTIIQLVHVGVIKLYLIRIKKSPFSQLRKGKARLTLLQPATENSKEGKTKQRAKDRKTKKKKNMKAVWTTVPVSHLFSNHQQ